MNQPARTNWNCGGRVSAGRGAGGDVGADGPSEVRHTFFSIKSTLI